MERKRLNGQITIFISMIMMCVFALICGLLESARTAGARWYIQTAASSAMDSVFSQYHRQMWDSYRLMFAEFEDEEELAADFKEFLQPYLENGGWYPMELNRIDVEDWHTATDDQGMYFEQEILDYMKYGIWKTDFQADEAVLLWENAKEAGAVKAVAERYRGHAKEALKLENALEAISESQVRQQQKIKEGLQRLNDYDGSGFRKAGRELIRELEKMPGLVEVYRKRADQLASSLQQSRLVFESEKNDCTSQVQESLEQEILQYESYVDEDGKRRKEIESLSEQSAEQIALVEAVIEEAKEVEEIIEEWEDDDDEESDGPDLEELWSPVIRHFQQLTIHTLSFYHGVKDKEKEGWLEEVEKLYRSGILELVVPEGTEVSKGVVDLETMPSHSEIMTEGARGILLPEHVIINEYCGRFFRCFRTGMERSGNETQETKTQGKEIQRSKTQEAKTQEAKIQEAKMQGAETQAMLKQESETWEIGVAGDGGLAYELEYMIGSEDMDEANLMHVVNRLLMIREGLNMIHLLSDTQKREEARNLAMTITGVFGLSPLVLLTTFFVLSVWALGEALMDVRGLLGGKRVAIFKTAEDWTLTIEELLRIGREGFVMTGGGERGLTYLSWLKILLFLTDIVSQEYRMMDMIQMNIRRKQDSFRMRRSVYQSGLTAQLSGKHVFFSLGFVDNFLGYQDHSYLMKVSAEHVY